MRRPAILVGAVLVTAICAVSSLPAEAAAPYARSPRAFSPYSGSLGALSCGSPGNCSAVGAFTLTTGGSHGYVANETNATWGKAEDIVHLSTYNQIQLLSCPSAGNCSAAGNDRGPSGPGLFVLGETKGVWGKPAAIGGLGSASRVLAISCASAGNCVAAGGDSNGTGVQPFVLTERNGVWGKVKLLQASGAIDTLSCPSIGNCSAGGFFLNPQAFVVSEKNGVWGKVEEVPDFATLNTVGPGTVLTISCWSAGNCSAGGNYRNSSGNQGFVVNERAGVWGKAANLSGLIALNRHGEAYVTTISCVSGGNCAAGGTYYTAARTTEAFFANEKNGKWGSAAEVPGFSALNAAGSGSVHAVSCGSAGSCTIGGSYEFLNGSGDDQSQPYLATETNGKWATAEEVPGLTAISSGGPESALLSVSCRSAGNCSAGGNYYDSNGYGAPFVVAETNGTWGKGKLVPGFT